MPSGAALRKSWRSLSGESGGAAEGESLLVHFEKLGLGACERLCHSLVPQLFRERRERGKGSSEHHVGGTVVSHFLCDARGIDVDDVDIVFNCDIPDENQDYIHRIGRTGRAKRQGIAVNFISDYPSKLRIDDIASKTRNEIIPVVFDDEGKLAVVEK